MNEIDIRRKVYSLPLKPNTKLTLLGVLLRVNWDTLEGQVSSNDVSKDLNMKASSVRRAFKELVELGYISRTAQRRESPKGTVYHHRAVTVLNINMVLDNSLDSYQPRKVSPKRAKQIEDFSTTEKVSPKRAKVVIEEVSSNRAIEDEKSSKQANQLVQKERTLSSKGEYPTKLEVSYNTTKDITTKETTKENNNNTAEIDSPTVSDDTTVMNDIPVDPKTLDDLNLSDKEAEVYTEEFLVRAVMNNRRLSAKMAWRYQKEASSTRKETSYDPYKRF
jgi:DNA-binding Lrp family transcriptional regulator